MKKNRSVFFGMSALFLMFGASLTGCSSTPVPFSFAENEAHTAIILFSRGNPEVRLVYVGDRELPRAEPKTHWAPLMFPAGQPLKITVHAWYYQTNTSTSFIGSLISSAITASRSVDKDVLFECPALTAGKSYTLSFRKGAGTTGRNLLVLTDAETGKVAHSQEFDSK
ncbi:MAG: hypothetical protein Ta2A_18930 [Treponemataceae bacterium]|nr:MAG: hypothetical protein Ta2A_18930 [Treponemataceae bacterium]